MTYRQSDSSYRDGYSKPQSRLNQQIRCDSTDEGCPVMEKSGSVCGETENLGIFQEFRQLYDECLKNLEESQDGSSTLRKLAPFKKLIDDLWAQNTMLVETVEELEQEATCRVTNLQDKLNKSCQKVCEYKEDIETLIMIVQSFCKNDVFDPSQLKFNTICPALLFGACKNSHSEINEIQERESKTALKRRLSLKNSISELICEESEERSSITHDVAVTRPPSEAFSSKRLSWSSRNSKKRNFLKKSMVEGASDLESCSLDDCYSFKSFSQSNKSENTLMEDADYLECMQPININFNIGNDSISDSTDCCCDCSCMKNNTVTKKH